MIASPFALMTKRSLPRSANEGKVASFAALGKVACLELQRSTSRTRMRVPLRRSVHHEDVNLCHSGKLYAMPMCYPKIKRSKDEDIFIT